MTTRESFIERMRAMHNDIGLYGHTDLSRLIGFHEDDTDFYYHLRGIQRPVKDREFYGSAVGPFLSLKPWIPPRDYEAMDRIFTLNGALPSDEFLISAS